MNRIASIIITVIAVVITLIYGQQLLIPFVFALLLWFLVREIRNQLERIPFIKKAFPSWVKSVLTSVVILAILAGVSKILTTNINALAKSYPLYEKNINDIVLLINDTFSINLMEMIQSNARDFDFGAILGSILNSLTDILGNAFMILIYMLFIFLEEANFDTKLRAIFKDEKQYNQVAEILQKVGNSVTQYIGLKTLVSLITGVVSYIALLLIGIDSPAFWAFLIFMLNFIPTVGSLVATVFPALFCVLQFGDLFHGTITLVIVGAIQVIVGNLIEPKLMGNSLNLSSLVAIAALAFWGSIWGVTGMILSIPITVIIVIICSQFESTKAIAILLSEKGKIAE